MAKFPWYMKVIKTENKGATMFIKLNRLWVFYQRIKHYFNGSIR